jgi:hypothetical protein
MSLTIVLHTALQRLLSPARMLVVFAVVTFPALVLSFAPQLGLHLLQSGAVLGLILGAGLLGQEVSSGVLQLLFARPVTRSEYVLGRWLGAAALAGGAVLLQIALGVAAMAMRGAPAPLGAVAGVAIEQALAAFGVVAVLALFSSVLPGAGDILAWILMNVTGGVLQMMGGFLRSPALTRASEEWGRFLTPTPALQPVFAGGDPSWFAIVSYLSTVTLCLAAAIAILARRELSYATD